MSTATIGGALSLSMLGYMAACGGVYLLMSFLRRVRRDF